MIDTNNYFDRGFKIGIFLLPSAPIISGIIFLITGVYASIKRKNSYFNDKWNIPFFIMGILMITSTFIVNFQINDKNSRIFSLLNDWYSIEYTDFYNLMNTDWIGLFNWLPYIWVFWAFQYYSFSFKQRKTIELILLSGSVPVFISGILQYFFNVNGPFIFLNGLITWFSKPVTGYNGLSGLFSNANYTGTWLNIIWPFSLVFFLEKKEKYIHKVISTLFLLIIVLTTILTLSRNALLGLILGIIIICGLKLTRWLIPAISIISIPIIASIGVINNQFIINLSRKFVPSLFWKYRFSEIGFDNFSNFERIEIWNYAIKIISANPLWGWGSSNFAPLLRIESGLYKHPHNLILELGVSYGIISSIIFLITLLLLIYCSYRKMSFQSTNESKYDLAWRTSFILVFTQQIFDIQYFDFRISFIFWILLGGMRNLIK